MHTAGCYTRRVDTLHPKQIRRRLLIALYGRYLEDPLEMLEPAFFLRDQGVSRRDLVPNMHYLSDRGLVELMLGYNPPLFAGVRITAKGIDLVENRFEFNRLFPPELGEEESAQADVPVLVERLVFEIDMAQADGETRHALIRDVNFIRDEIARPVLRWRIEVIRTVIGWMREAVRDAAVELPSLDPLEARLLETAHH